MPINLKRGIILILGHNKFTFVPIRLTCYSMPINLKRGIILHFSHNKFTFVPIRLTCYSMPINLKRGIILILVTISLHLSPFVLLVIVCPSILERRYHHFSQNKFTFVPIRLTCYSMPINLKRGIILILATISLHLPPFVLLVIVCPSILREALSSF